MRGEGFHNSRQLTATLGRFHSIKSCLTRSRVEASTGFYKVGISTLRSHIIQAWTTPLKSNSQGGTNGKWQGNKKRCQSKTMKGWCVADVRGGWLAIGWVSEPRSSAQSSLTLPGRQRGSFLWLCFLFLNFAFCPFRMPWIFLPPYGINLLNYTLAPFSYFAFSVSISVTTFGPRS